MKLLTIGDGFSQGFLSLANARTDLAFSKLIAETLNVKDYSIPVWPQKGIPFSLEYLLRKLQDKFPDTLNDYSWDEIITFLADEVHKSEGIEFIKNKNETLNNNIKLYHNISIAGFKISDSWKITQEICNNFINKQLMNGNDQVKGKTCFYKIASHILNPGLHEEFSKFSQLDWLKYYHLKSKEGVENLILWLGIGNVVSTLFKMTIKQTSNSGNSTLQSHSHEQIQKHDWNLWHPEDFRSDYTELINRIDSILRKNDNGGTVFVGTIPLVTIFPLIKGVGPEYRITRNNEDITYFKYYTYMPFEYECAQYSSYKFTMNQVIYIDDCIRNYNESIKQIIQIKNNEWGYQKYMIVDIAEMFNKLALKRNNYNLSYEFPDFFKFKYPAPNSKYYCVNSSGDVEQGGLFSLDGVYPSAICHGLIAFEFLKIFDKKYSTNFKDQLNWKKIFDSDSLYSNPIQISSEIYKNEKLAELWVKIIRYHKEDCLIDDLSIINQTHDICEEQNN